MSLPGSAVGWSEIVAFPGQTHLLFDPNFENSVDPNQQASEKPADQGPTLYSTPLINICSKL